MGNLLSIARAPVYPALKSLSQNRVERFLHVQVQHRIGEAKGNCFHQFLNKGLLVQILQQFGGICHTDEQPFKIALGDEDIHREADIEDTLAREYVLANFGQNELQDSLLILYFLLIDKGKPPNIIIPKPVTFPYGMPINIRTLFIELLLHWPDRKAAFNIPTINNHIAFLV